jgi:hypothetical protein
MATDELDETRLLNAIFTLTDLATRKLSGEEQGRLVRVVETLQKGARSTEHESEAKSDMTLVEELERIYQRVFDAEAGKPNSYAPDTYTAVKQAAEDWAISRGKPVSERLSQDQLEELELDADEIRAIKCRNTNGNPRHAAIMQARTFFGISDSTTYERIQKGLFAAHISYDPELDAEGDYADRVHRIAAAIRATTGLPVERAYEEAARLSKEGLAALIELAGSDVDAKTE